MANHTNAMGEEEVCSITRRKPRSRLGAAVALAIAALAPFAADALPVLPGLTGPGSDTPAGRGGTVHRVTNLNASGAGSLKACVDATGPRVCVFEVSGIIRMPGDLVIRNPQITIAGQTAPSPGITLRGGALLVKTSDVLVQHIHVRPGDDPEGQNPDNRDALKIEATETAPARKVVIDHSSFTWAIDETASAWIGWRDIILSNNIFAEALNESLHSKGRHGYGVLLGPVQSNATMTGNLIAHTVERNPLSSTAKLVFVNNVVYNRSTADMVLSTVGGYQTFNTVAGNVFMRGPNHSRDSLPIQIRANGEDKLASGSRVYLSDNEAQGVTADSWSLVGAFMDGGSPIVYKSETPPVWPANMVRLPAADNVTLNNVLKSAGARPADRDPVDARIVESVRNRTGRIVNCVAPNGTARCELNAGGWPNIPQNRRPLTLPADPNGVTPSGYTNLEVWLHGMAAEVEGRTSSPPVAPVLQ